MCFFVCVASWFFFVLFFVCVDLVFLCVLFVCLFVCLFLGFSVCFGVPSLDGRRRHLGNRRPAGGFDLHIWVAAFCFVCLCVFL